MQTWDCIAGNRSWLLSSSPVKIIIIFNVYLVYCNCVKHWTFFNSAPGRRQVDVLQQRATFQLSFFFSKYVVWVALLFGPLAPCLAASAIAYLSSNWAVSWPLVLRLLAFAELCSTGPASPPEHLENHLIWVDSIKVIPLACCRMSLERLVGSRNFPTTLVTLSLQLWNYWFCTGVLQVRHPCFMRAFHELFSLLEKQKGPR
jgi:hypothetical protein